MLDFPSALPADAPEDVVERRLVLLRHTAAAERLQQATDVLQDDAARLRGVLPPEPQPEVEEGAGIGVLERVIAIRPTAHVQGAVWLAWEAHDQHVEGVRLVRAASRAFATRACSAGLAIQ